MKTPTKTVEFLDAIKEKYDLQSDYKLSKFTGLLKGTISNYRTGKSCLDAPVAMEIAYWLDLPEGYVLACVQAEREERAKRTEIAETWKRVAKSLRVAMLAGLLVFLGWTAPQDAAAATHKAFNNVSENIYYTHVELWRRRLRKALRRSRRRFLRILRTAGRHGRDVIALPVVSLLQFLTAKNNNSLGGLHA